MPKKTPVWSNLGAWREILERVFESFDSRESFAPDWMVNPYTGRRLKLDHYYPELGVAIRFIGLQGRGGYRISDEEAQQEDDRNHIRHWLCQRQGVTLVQIDADEPEPWRILHRIRAALSKTSRLLAQSDVAHEMKQGLAPRIADARRRCDEIAGQLHRQDGLRLFADLWRDRQYPLSTETSTQDESAPSCRASTREWVEGLVVQHPSFGRGTIIGLAGEGEDAMVTIGFDDGSTRKFLVGLVAGKLEIER